MSLFGILTILYVLYLGYLLLKRTPLDNHHYGWLLFIFVFQLIFLFMDKFTLYYLFLTPLQVIFAYLHAILAVISVPLLAQYLRKKWMGITMTILILLTLPVTEYANGTYTFNSWEEHRSYNMELKRHFFLAPYKTVKGQDRDTVEVYRLFMTVFVPTIIKRESGTIYYLERGGFGNPDRWWQFGIPKGEQVLL